MFSLTHWLGICALGLSAGLACAEPSARPNIVWIVVDDMSANFSCYGEPLIHTPHVDRLAREGTRFSHAFVTAPVCSPCRSALITGCYQTTIGAHHHRSGRGKLRIRLPAGIVPVPELFRRAGYYTCIGGYNASGTQLGKTDYNFDWDPAMYDGNDWSGRRPGQPFFMQVQLHGGKYRGQGLAPEWTERVRKTLGPPTDPASVILPPYYPRDRVLLEDWARYLDCCRMTDLEVGEVLTRLEREELLDQTIVVFMTDHGISHARGKQFLYDEGLHIPLIVRGPGIPADCVRDDLVEHIDLAATSLAWAGIEIPASLQGRDVFAKGYVERDAVFAARDRCDETVERLRSVRTMRYKYIRNYLPSRPHLQPNHYKDSKAIVRRLRELHSMGQLNELQDRLLFRATRGSEELYDLAVDPHETHNLAESAEHQEILASMRKKLSDWETKTHDQGRNPESAEMYDSDMAVYLNDRGPSRSEALETLRKNIELMRLWKSQGK
jgi:arylsulfatase A-like enzyme